MKQAWNRLPAIDAAVIFLAATLLFEVEPLIAKLILPWFGGSAAVWLSCLLFFQAALLGGYLYAHFLARFVPPRIQGRIHIAALLVSLAALPILPSPQWKPTGTGDPQLHILGLLASTIGIPFLLLSSTTPLITAWRSNSISTASSQSLVRLYALSNLGSMLALLSYPVLVEPAIPTKTQAMIWSTLYAVFVLVSIVVAWRHRSLAVTTDFADRDGMSTAPSRGHRLLWVLFPAAASALLLAGTSYILRNVAAIPLLWVVPLALYLASFVITFDSPRWYSRYFWLPLFAIFSGLLIYELCGLLFGLRLIPLLVFNSAGFFVLFVVCHGELVRLKPAPKYLTPFYLSISAGGVIGSICIAVVAPQIFNADIDLSIVLPATIFLVAVSVFLDVRSHTKSASAVWAFVSILIILGLATGGMTERLGRELAGATYLERNFYGALRVADSGPMRALVNGNIMHGTEFMAQDRLTQPTSYYGKNSGMGLALANLSARGNLRVGVIGLGAGTLAAYGRPGDNYHFYEINPADTHIAQTYFHYLQLARSRWEISTGDARLSLENEQPQNYDFLVVDAFTSDSIPVHLLTREAFALYSRHLKSDGVLAVHVSNRYLNLAPLVVLAANKTGKIARIVESAADVKNAQSAAEWVIVAPDPAFFHADNLRTAKELTVPPSLTAWTDDYSNLWQYLR